MADGLMAIYRGNQHVGDVRWTGTMGRGTWRFVPQSTFPDADRNALTTTVEGLPAARRELRWLYFAGPRGTDQAGWSGFSGTWGALSMALIAVGMRIHPAASRWVRGLGPSAPDDVRLPENPGDDTSDAAADQWEILALQARTRDRV